MSEAFSLLMFPAIIGILFLGFPIAFSLMGVALVFGLITFGPVVIFQFAMSPYEDWHVLAWG